MHYLLKYCIIYLYVLFTVSLQLEKSFLKAGILLCFVHWYIPGPTMPGIYSVFWKYLMNEWEENRLSIQLLGGGAWGGAGQTNHSWILGIFQIPLNSFHLLVYNAYPRFSIFALVVCSPTISYQMVLKDILHLGVSRWLFLREPSVSIKYL